MGIMEGGDMAPEGESILQMSIANTGFQKRTEHLITYKSGSQTNTHIDYLLMRKPERKLMEDAKVVPGETVTHQHRQFIVDMKFKRK